MEDLAALNDVTGPAVLNALQERYKQGLCYTYFGDYLLSINPCHEVRENESELGQWYRTCKSIQDLPPHVVAVAHRAYRMLVNDVMPQAIVITGRAGSGKTEAARRIISQFLREARLSPIAGLGPRLVMAQHILTTLMSARTLHNPDSTRGIKMATLNFRQDGHLVSAELQGLCMEKWFLVDRGTGSGAFSIFYGLMAGLSQQEQQLYYLVDKYRLLSKNDASPVFSTREEHSRYLNMFDFFMNSLENTGIDEKAYTYDGRSMSAIIAVLAAILHLSNVDVVAHAHTGQPVITNHHELRAVCDLLSLDQNHMEAEILSSTLMVRGEVARVACSVDQALWNRDVLMVEMYRRLVSVVTTRLNKALSPDTHYVYIDHGPLTSIMVVESLAQEVDTMTGGLETFCRNMASERVQYHLYDVIFQHDLETCEREKVQAYKIKYAHNTELISAVFGPDYGIMNKVTAVTTDPQGTPEKLVQLMDNDKALKKTGCYVNAGKAVKSSEVFFIKHAGLGQVTYTARDFIIKNRSALPESSRQMLLHSGNPIVPALATVTFHDPGYPPDVTTPDAHFATRTFQSDLTYLIQTLDSAKLHYIRCLKASGSTMAGHFDPQVVTDQLKESCVVETIRQRKFGYSECVTQDLFVRSYRELAYSAFSKIPSVHEASKVILKTTGLHGKGVTLSKTSVFLRYWHFHRLHTLKDERMRRVVLAQAAVRGFLVRRRLRSQMMRSRNHRQSSGQFGLPRGGFNSPHSPTSPTGNGVGGKQAFNRRISEVSLYSPLNDYASSIVTDDPSGIYSQIIGKVLSSLHTLESTTWAKIIYLERGRQVAKVYADDRSIMIDGSSVEYDGERLGLGALRNQARDEETAYYKASIMEGLRLKRDSDGSISACRLCDQPIIVKGLDDLDIMGCLSADVIVNRGQLPFEQTIKIFDIAEFRSKIALDLKQRRFSREKMRRACVVSLAFGRDDPDDVKTPCWLCIVNVKALTSLDSEEIIREAQHHTAKLEITSPEVAEEKMKADEVKARHARGRWARTDQRQHLQEKEEGSRHVRQQLRAKGLEIGQHVGYSWEYNQGEKMVFQRIGNSFAIHHIDRALRRRVIPLSMPQSPSNIRMRRRSSEVRTSMSSIVTGGDKTTMEDLHQWMEPRRQSGRSRASGGVRDWAKVETVIRDERTKGEHDARSPSAPQSPGY